MSTALQNNNNSSHNRLWYVITTPAYVKSKR